MRSLIDLFMPRWDVRERHAAVISAGPERVFAALKEADLGRHFLARGLLALRSVPAIFSKQGGIRAWRSRAGGPFTLTAFEEHGFRILAENPPHELLIGLQGRFWRPSGELEPVDAKSFREPVPVGLARAAWNFSVSESAPGRSRLCTETRVLSGDPATARRFRVYWFAIRPASGLIRRLMLREIRRHVERNAPSATERP